MSAARKIPLRWLELREAYPRIVEGMVLGIAVLLLADLALASKRVRSGREGRAQAPR